VNAYRFAYSILPKYATQFPYNEVADWKVTCFVPAGVLANYPPIRKYSCTLRALPTNKPPQTILGLRRFVGSWFLR
jgi:hypothetical protein